MIIAIEIMLLAVNKIIYCRCSGPNS